jgi:hypothetical protein
MIEKKLLQIKIIIVGVLSMSSYMVDLGVGQLSKGFRP